MDNSFDIEKWRKEHPIDYTKALDILESIDNPVAVAYAMQQLFSVFKMYIPDVLFKYYSFTDDVRLNKTKIDTLRDGKIYLSDPNDFNDPFDEKGYYYKPERLAELERLKHTGGKLIDDFSQYMRASSLSANDFNCMPMWAHYSNNHKGFCVSYDMKALDNQILYSCTFPVQYTCHRIDITDIIYEFAKNTCELIDENMKKGIKTTVMPDIRIPILMSFLGNIKHESWAYEKEFRCSVGASYKGSEYIDASPSGIYVGMKCSDENKKSLIELAIQKDIPIYQMTFVEESKGFVLKPLEINPD